MLGTNENGTVQYDLMAHCILHTVTSEMMSDMNKHNKI